MVLIRRLFVDIETYSGADLIGGGLHKYVRSPDFTVLLIGYSVDGNEVEIIDLASESEKDKQSTKDRLRVFYEMLKDPQTEKYAHNANFELECLSVLFGETLSAFNWNCTMVGAYYAGLPGSLAMLTEALKLPRDKQKQSVGMSLIRTFSTPCKPTRANGNRTRTLPEHEPDKWELFKEYCKQDVVAEMAVADALEAWPMPISEKMHWRIDRDINKRGVKLDREFVECAIEMADTIGAKMLEEAKELTGLDNPNSPSQIKAYLLEHTGEEVNTLSKSKVGDMLEATDDPKIARVLELRSEMSKTSVKKYEKMMDVICDDDRARGLLQFYAAKTGRWGGRLIQVQNLPRGSVKALETARRLVLERDTFSLEFLFGSISEVLSSLIRSAFIPKEGCRFVVADYAAIEARVLAWLASETWREDVFKVDGDIYCTSASKMFGVPVEKHGINKELRQKGKIAELALGYGGGVKALEAMGGARMGLSFEELPPLVTAWRSASPSIVALWRELESKAVEAVRTCTETRATKRGIVFAMEDGKPYPALAVTLPSGRKLYYQRAELVCGKFGTPQVAYYSTGTTSTFCQTQTYGGSLTENIVQAIARDILAEALRRLWACKFDVVMHVHDEVVIECEATPEQLKKINQLMTYPPKWASALHLTADAFVAGFYRKD